MERQQQSPLVDEPPPAPPRRPLIELLSAFMEEKNIRWGELVGGLLIVGCSIALVISFWATIAERPLFKFVLFNGVTAALFGLGIYAQVRLKLPTTSQGLVIIATLLVPLNFLAIAAISGGETPAIGLTIAGEVLSACLFAWLIYRGGRIVVERWPSLLAIGVLVPSIDQLLVRRFVDPSSEMPVLFALALVPIACYCAVTARMLWGLRASQTISESQANAVFKLHGMTSFAALVPLALLISKTGSNVGSLQQLSPLLILLGSAPLAVGLFLWRRVTDPLQAGTRTAGTTIGVLGGVVLLAAVVLAPNPACLLSSAALDFVILTTLALSLELPEAHVLAIPCLVLAYLVGFNLATGHMAWSDKQDHEILQIVPMLRSLLSAVSGTALAPLVLLLAVASSAWRRAGRAGDGLIYLYSTVPIAALSLLLVSCYGFGVEDDPWGVTWVYAFYAVAALGAAFVPGYDRAAWAGSLLLLAALWQGLVFKFADTLGLEFPGVAALLLHGSLMSTGALVLRATSAPARSVGARLSETAVATSLGGAVLAHIQMWPEVQSALAIDMYWVAAIWLVVAVLHSWAELFTAFQVALTYALVLSVVVHLQQQAWFQEAANPWLEPRTLQAAAIALAMLNLAWIVVRCGFRFASDRWGARAANTPAPGPEMSGGRVGLLENGAGVPVSPAGGVRPDCRARAVVGAGLAGLVFGHTGHPAGAIAARLAARLDGERWHGKCAAGAKRPTDQRLPARRVSGREQPILAAAGPGARRYRAELVGKTQRLQNSCGGCRRLGGLPVAGHCLASGSCRLLGTALDSARAAIARIGASVGPRRDRSSGFADGLAQLRAHGSRLTAHRPRLVARTDADALGRPGRHHRD